MKPWRRSSATASCAARSCRKAAPTTHTCTTCCCGTSPRTAFIERLNSREIHSVFHYVPLHTSTKGRVIGQASGAMTHTDDLSERLVRLPLWIGLEAQLPRVLDEVITALG
jgi:dTDP-4-amino-4,6-dideoxygalactose transaminase